MENTAHLHSFFANKTRQISMENGQITMESCVNPRFQAVFKPGAMSHRRHRRATRHLRQSRDAVWSMRLGVSGKNAGTEDMVKFMKHLGKTGQECIRMPWKLRWMMVNASFKSMQRDSSWLFPFVSSIFFDARDVKVQASQVRSAVRVAVVPCGIVEGFRFPWTPNPACLGSDVGCGG